MNNEAQTQIEARQGDLAALVEQKDAALLDLQAIEEERAAAVRALARGDGRQRKVILDLEGKIKPLKLTVEGLDGLVAEAQGKVSEAQAALKEAQAKEEAEMQIFLEERGRQECEGICAAVAGRKKRIFNLWLELNQEVAALFLDKLRVEDLAQKGLTCQRHKEAVNLPDTLALQLGQMAREAGYVPFGGPGYVGQIMGWAMVKPPPEFAHHGVLDFFEYRKWRAQQIESGYIAEFKEERGLSHE